MIGPTRRAPPGPPLTKPWALLATWFGSGRLPFAPGTWGSLAALPFAAALQWVGGPWLLVAASVLVFLAGCWASVEYVRATGRKDPPEIVIDEVVGQWIALILSPFTLQEVALAFVLFRSFDIVKPWPIRWIERRWPGPLGVMLDDVAAGLMALAIMALVHLVPA